MLLNGLVLVLFYRLDLEAPGDEAPAGELVGAVGEQPALLRPRLHPCDGAAEDRPVVAGRLGHAGRAGGADQQRLRVAGLS